MTRDEKLSNAFNALSHPRRVRIFRLLADNPETGRTLTRLQQANGYKQAPLLHHLQVMERAGLIGKRRVGATVARVVAVGPLTAAFAEILGIVPSAARRALQAASPDPRRG